MDAAGLPSLSSSFSVIGPDRTHGDLLLKFLFLLSFLLGIPPSREFELDFLLFISHTLSVRPIAPDLSQFLSLSSFPRFVTSFSPLLSCCVVLLPTLVFSRRYAFKIDLIYTLG